MSDFMTDKQAEAWLQSETRDLPMPGGSMRTHTTAKMIWATADGLIQKHRYTMEELVICTLETAELNSMDFDRAFTNTIGMLEEYRQDFMKKHG